MSPPPSFKMMKPSYGSWPEYSIFIIFLGNVFTILFHILSYKENINALVLITFIEDNTMFFPD